MFIDSHCHLDFPELAAEPDAAARRIRWFDEVCRRTAVLVAHWMRVGFVHGVMNTDNMSILGLTIDYGPYGWVDDFDPDWTPNTTDAGGRRYRFGNQPFIADMADEQASLISVSVAESGRPSNWRSSFLKSIVSLVFAVPALLLTGGIPRN